MNLPTRFRVLRWAIRRGIFFTLALTVNLPAMCIEGIFEAVSDSAGWFAGVLRKGRSTIWESVQFSLRDENPVDAYRRIAKETANLKVQLTLAEGRIMDLEQKAKAN